MNVNRVCRIFLAALVLFLCVAAVPVQVKAEPSAPIGRIVDGIWRLDPANYTYRALQNTKELDLSGKGIKAIEGIEHLGGLVSLNLSYNELESLDLSTCRKLTELNCSNNRLSSLDISPCGRLKVLDCSDNPIEELSVASAKSLQTLDCRNCGLKTLDTKANRVLTELYCSGNELAAIEVGHLKRLKVLDAGNTGISALDVSKNDALTALNCSSNPDLKELNLKTNTHIRELYTDGTAIVDLDLTKMKGLAEMFFSENGYQYEFSDEARTWKLENGILRTGHDTTIRVGSTIAIRPSDEDERSRVALPGYLKYKPGEFTSFLLGASYDEMCHYFSIKVGPNGSIFRKTEEPWIYENAHTVVEAAGIAVQARREETVKIKSATRVFTVFDQDGSFRFRCTIDYMANETAWEFAKRLNKDHETPDAEDLWGYTGQVRYFVCGNALVILEGIPSIAHEKTPTLESYILSDPVTPLYLVN